MLSYNHLAPFLFFLSFQIEYYMASLSSSQFSCTCTHEYIHELNELPRPTTWRKREREKLGRVASSPVSPERDLNQGEKLPAAAETGTRRVRLRDWRLAVRWHGPCGTPGGGTGPLANSFYSSPVGDVTVRQVALKMRIIVHMILRHTERTCKGPIRQFTMYMYM